MKPDNIIEKFSEVTEYWSPKIIAEVNDSYVKIVKAKGEFVWYNHEEEDELFYIIKGEFILKFEDSEIKLKENDFYIVPKKINHCPVAKEECWVMVIEKKSTKHTGDLITDITKDIQQQLR